MFPLRCQLLGYQPNLITTSGILTFALLRQAGARHGHHVHAACGARDELLDGRGASPGILRRRCLHRHRWCSPALHSLKCPVGLRSLFCLSHQKLKGYGRRFCCDT